LPGRQSIRIENIKRPVGRRNLPRAGSQIPFGDDLTRLSLFPDRLSDARIKPDRRQRAQAGLVFSHRDSRQLRFGHELLGRASRARGGREFSM
jgi:hypothetical protein